MYFEQLHPTVYDRLLDKLPANHAYNGKTQQLVIWTTEVDRVLAKAIQLAQGLYEMNA